MDNQVADRAYAKGWWLVGGKRKVASNSNHEPSQRSHDLP